MKERADDSCRWIRVSTKVESKKLNVAFCAFDRRLDHAANSQAQRLRDSVDFVDYALVLRRIFYDAAFAYFAFANFELRFDKRDNTAGFNEQRRDGRQNLGERNER